MRYAVRRALRPPASGPACNCEDCDADFRPARPWSRFCGPACRARIADLLGMTELPNLVALSRVIPRKSPYPIRASRETPDPADDHAYCDGAPRSTAGSPKASARWTSRRQRRCSTSCNDRSAQRARWSVPRLVIARSDATKQSRPGRVQKERDCSAALAMTTWKRRC